MVKDREKAFFAQITPSKGLAQPEDICIAPSGCVFSIHVCCGTGSC